MKVYVKIFVLNLLFLVIFLMSSAQRFAKEVADMLMKERNSVAIDNPILFAGSSSFTNWKDVQDYFPGRPILNRGFGGSTLKDQIRFADSIYFNIKPRQIVIYCGENDLAESSHPRGMLVYKRFIHLYKLIRSHFPDLSIVYISMKPSPSRRHLFPAMLEANRSIEDFLKQQENVHFIDVFPLMLKKDGEPLLDIFLDDQLHMNSKGYEIWRKSISPILL